MNSKDDDEEEEVIDDERRRRNDSEAGREREAIPRTGRFDVMMRTTATATAAEEKERRGVPNFLASNRILGKGESYGERKSITKRGLIF